MRCAEPGCRRIEQRVLLRRGGRLWASIAWLIPTSWTTVIGSWPSLLDRLAKFASFRQEGSLSLGTPGRKLPLFGHQAWWLSARKRIGDCPFAPWATASDQGGHEPPFN